MDEPGRFDWLSWVAVPLLVLHDTQVVHMNAAARTLFAPDGEQILPRSLESFIGRVACNRLTSLLRLGASSGVDATLVLPFWVGDAPHDLNLTLTKLPAPAGHHLVTVVDLGTRSATPDQSSPIDWTAVLPNVLDLLPIGLHIEDSKLNSVYVNDDFLGIFGYTMQEIADPELWWPLVYPDVQYRELVKRQWFAAVAEAEAKNSEIVPQEFEVVCKDGCRKVIQFHCRRVGAYHVHAYVDVSARHRLERELRHTANTDTLTGIPNRRSFFDAAKAAVATGQSLAVLLCDLDHFKAINDEHGHAVGDKVLTQVVARFAGVLDGGHLLARLGGEEFAVLLPNCDRAAAGAVAERLRAAVARTLIATCSRGQAVTVSIGGAFLQAEETDIDALLVRADRALYAAKRAGRNQVCVQSEEDRDSAPTVMTLRRRDEAALAPSGVQTSQDGTRSRPIRAS